MGTGTPLGRALRAGLERRGAAEVLEIENSGDNSWRGIDVLALCDTGADEVAFVESLADATRNRQLPPEVWVVHERPDDPTARHYVGDVRVSYVRSRAELARAPI